MKYVGVTHSFNDTDYTDITCFSIGKIYWFKFYEDDLGPIDEVKIGQHVVVDTCRGLAVGRIVKKSGDGLSLALNSGMLPEKITRQVVDFVNIGPLAARASLTKEVDKAEEAMCDWINRNNIEDVYAILAERSEEFKVLLTKRDRLVDKLKAEK